MVPLQEQEVIQAIRLLTRFGQVQQDPTIKEEDIQKELTETDPNTRLNLQQLLGSLAAKAATAEEEDTPLLMKAAEHMAIRFALERYQKGEVKVNAVHQMMEHMSRQMDSLRSILKLQEEKMSKAGILVESHADILDRMFLPDSGTSAQNMRSRMSACDSTRIPALLIFSSCSFRMERSESICRLMCSSIWWTAFTLTSPRWKRSMA